MRWRPTAAAAAVGLSDNSTSDGQTFCANSLATARVRRTSCSVFSRSCHKPSFHCSSAISCVYQRVGGGRIFEPLQISMAAALRNQPDEAFLRAKLGDLGDCADTEALLSTASTTTALDQHYTEPRPRLEQPGQHDQVASSKTAAQWHGRE